MSRQVVDLKSLTTVKVNEILLAKIREVHSDIEQKEELRRIIHQTVFPDGFLQKFITTQIDPDSKLNDKIRIAILDVFLCKKIYKLVLKDFQANYLGEILDIVLKCNPDLHFIDLNEFYINKEEHLSKLFRILQKCKNLVKLIMWKLDSPNTLFTILRLCPQLRVLKFDHNLNILSTLNLKNNWTHEHLKELDLGYEFFEDDLVEEKCKELLRCFPNLETCSCIRKTNKLSIPMTILDFRVNY